MEVSAATSQTQPKSVIASQNLADNLDNFLMLLVAQLKNQDPLEPMSTNEFTNQIVQFAGVEQSIATNANLESLLALQRANQTAALVGYLGKRIEANGDTTALADGRAEWAYALPKRAAEVRLLVTDKAGKPVHTSAGMNEAGAHRFVWDGRDNAGTPMPEGRYTLTVTAIGADGEKIAAALTTVGTVTGIETAGDEPVLFVGTTGVPLSEVLAVLGPPADANQQQEQS